MASASGLGLQADGVIMEFTRCWGYLGQVGVMARDMVNLIEGEGTENIDMQNKKAQLSRIIYLVEKAANLEPKEEKLKSKKCNFYNRGFCYQGTACTFVHPQEVCELHEQSGTCGRKMCNKRHLYNCRYYNSESGCGRGDSCSFSHRSRSRIVADDQEKFVNGVVAANVLEKHPVGTDEEEGKRKGKLGVGEFGWMPIDSEAASAKTLDLLKPEDSQTEPEMLKGESKSDKEEVMEKDDLYASLIEAMKEGNSKLEDEMLDKILEGFEDVEHERDNTKKNMGKKVKGKQVGIKKTRKKVGSLAWGRGR